MSSNRGRGTVVVSAPPQENIMDNTPPVESALQLDLREHMKRTTLTAVYPFAGKGDVQGLMYVGLGLAGEAGEVANQIKKIARDNGGVVTPERRDKIADELGDVWWYGLRICYEMGLDPYEVLARNQQKLQQRAVDGTLGGDRRNGSLTRRAAAEWEADLVEAAGKEDVWAVPVEAMRALIQNGVLPEVDGRIPGYVVTCRSLRCADWSVEDRESLSFAWLHHEAMAHIMAEHTPWGRAGRD